MLKEHEYGVRVNELCREHGMSKANQWEGKARYSGLQANEAAPHHRLLVPRRRRWLGREDSNLRMPVPKTGALTAWPRPIAPIEAGET